MSTLHPFPALRPPRELAARVSSLPYDVMNHREAREMAAEMTADLRAQLEQTASGSEQDAHSSYDNVLLADRSFQNIGKMVIPSLRKLPQEQREAVANQLIRTLGQIQGEVSQCL